MLLLLLCADLVQDYHGHGALRHRRVQLRKSSHVCFRGLWLRVRLSFLWTGMEFWCKQEGFSTRFQQNGQQKTPRLFNLLESLRGARCSVATPLRS